MQCPPGCLAARGRRVDDKVDNEMHEPAVLGQQLSALSTWGAAGRLRVSAG